MTKASPVDLRNSVLAALLEVAPDVDPGALDPHVAFRDQFDFDSMDHLNLAIALHSSLGVDIPEQDYARLGSLDGCVAYIAQALGRSRSTS